jgi:hypothetical protein
MPPRPLRVRCLVESWVALVFLLLLHFCSGLLHLCKFGVLSPLLPTAASSSTPASHLHHTSTTTFLTPLGRDPSPTLSRSPSHLHSSPRVSAPLCRSRQKTQYQTCARRV